MSKETRKVVSIVQIVFEVISVLFIIKSLMNRIYNKKINKMEVKEGEEKPKEKDSITYLVFAGMALFAAVIAYMIKTFAG